jgi:hypothetical protein
VAGPARVAPRTDLDVLRASHRFLREADDDDGSWEAKLAQRYYDRLYREYVICDLADYRKGGVGFRWRTEVEVVQGRGQFQCGHRACTAKTGLRSYEVDFKYREAGKSKRALVKVRLCEACAYKLHYRRLKAERARARREGSPVRKSARSHAGSGAEGQRKRRTKMPPGDEVVIADDVDGDHDSGGNDSCSAAASDEDNRSPESAAQPSEADKARLEALAWTGPDPDMRTREDDIDDYLNEMFM